MKSFVTKLAPHFEGMAYQKQGFKRISLQDYKN